NSPTEYRGASVNVALPDNGNYFVRLVVDDGDQGATGHFAQIEVKNVAPTASITGVPASGHSPEGSHVLLGSSVTDPSSVDTAAGFTYVWRVNGVVYAWGNTPVSAFTPDDDGNFVVTLTVTDKDGGVSPVAQTTIVAYNVAPTAGVSGPTDGIPGQQLTFTLTAADPSTSDQNTGFSFAIAWGDGSSEMVNGPSGTTISHAYAEPGNYSLQVTATDKNGGISNTAAQTETIAGARLRAGALVVEGTTGNDEFVITPVTVAVARARPAAATASSLEVSLNGVDLGTFAPTGGIVDLDGDGGSDSVTINGTTGKDAFGGASGGITLDAFTVNLNQIATTTLNGLGGINTLTGLNKSNSWMITGHNAGTLDGNVRFTRMTNLTGGGPHDRFHFVGAGKITGHVNRLRHPAAPG